MDGVCLGPLPPDLVGESWWVWTLLPGLVGDSGGGFVGGFAV